MYTVKQAAEKLGLSEHTVRYYTDRELIPAVVRDKNNIRLFSEDALNWLLGVKYLRDSGMSIKAIKEYVGLCLQGDGSIEARHQIILRQRELARAQLLQAQKRLEFLEQKEQKYANIIAQNMPDSLNPSTWPTDTAKGG